MDFLASPLDARGEDRSERFGARAPELLNATLTLPLSPWEGRGNQVPAANNLKDNSGIFLAAENPCAYNRRA